MSDDLVLSGGGRTAVATDELLHVVERLRVLAHDAESWADRLSGAAALAAAGPPSVMIVPPSGVLPAPMTPVGFEAGADDLAVAAASIAEAGAEAERLAFALQLSAEAYGASERVQRGVFEALGSVLATTVGFLVGRVPGLLIPLLGVLVPASAYFAASMAFRTRPDGSPVDTLQDARRTLLSSEVFVAIVGLAVSSADDAMLGLAGLPPSLAGVFCDRGLGLFGVAQAAGVVGIAAAATGTLRNSGVTVGPVTGPVRRPPAGPAGFAAVMQRMPPSEHGAPQVRIERYRDAHGVDSWVVSTGGTIDASLQTGSEPLDMESNLRAVAEANAASVRATEQAMAAAGIPDGARVVQAGYSQGGIAAATVAASGRYDTTLVTFGAPVVGIELPEGVASLNVEHTEDLVPKLAGMRSFEVDGPTVVARSLWDGAPPPPAEGDDPLPAHARGAYEETARLMDDAQDARIAQVRDVLADVTSGEGTAVHYRAERVTP
ncbi:hypothetical protein [Plantibacter sp. YIM 135347]|uniref:hypothetical protein n=1 Tax=Plantibacter sp. YIM 135347 TaxID=3423919 RepID=UPI003D351964